MKKFALVCSALYALSMTAEVFAQTRGPRYNPPSGGSSSSGSRPSSSGSSGSSSGSRPSSGSSGSSSRPSAPSSSPSSRGPSYNPPSRPSTPSPSRPSAPSSPSPSSGPRYNPPTSPRPTPTPSAPSTPSTGPRYNPPSTPSTPSAPSTGPRYNPTPSAPSTPSTPVVTGPRYNNPGSGTVNAPRRGPSYNPPVSHTPVNVVVRGPRYNNPRDYYTSIPHHYVYRRWVQYPVMYWYTDGYWDIDGYPYYVNNGYRYRYSSADICQYELVDSQGYTTVRLFDAKFCSVAYDECAIERDMMNRTVSLDRYFCAEAVDKEHESVDESEYENSAVVMTDVRKAAIKAYLYDMSFKDIFRDGLNSGVNNCEIIKVGSFLSSNAYGCKYQVNVSSKGYPNADGSVCSSSKLAAKIGCSVGNQKANAGCILKKAIESGYCH